MPAGETDLKAVFPIVFPSSDLSETKQIYINLYKFIHQNELDRSS